MKVTQRFQLLTSRFTQALAAPRALAHRDGEWSELAVKELVPGDLIALKAGDAVPADCKVGKHKSLPAAWHAHMVPCLTAAALRSLKAVEKC